MVGLDVTADGRKVRWTGERGEVGGGGWGGLVNFLMGKNRA